MFRIRMVPELSYVPRNGIATARDKIARVAGKMQQRDFIHLMMARQNVADKLKEPKKKTPSVTAYINHGRWVANCECGGCEVVDPKDPIFMCFSCLNFASTNGELRKVVFPEKRKQIEAILVRRPKANRNWLVGETVAAIRAENTARGIAEAPNGVGYSIQ